MHRTSFRAAAAAAVLALAACGDAPSATRAPDAPRESDVALAEAGPALSAAAKAGAGGVTVLRFRSVEDADFPPDPSVCAAAGFGANVLLGASLWSEAATASEGRVVNDAVRQVGTATACVRITTATFPEGLRQEMYVRFHLREGTVSARGGCTGISNDVPQRGVVLAGCHLRVTEAPSWYAGGAVTSLSVFNPGRIPGFATGSEWTVQLYDAPRS